MSWSDPCGNCGNHRADCDCTDGYKSISTRSVFNSDIIRKVLSKEKSFCFIGVDSYDDKSLAYVLIRKTGDDIEYLLCKTMTNKADFDTEVKNLSKYFDADIFTCD
jgi:hypothetical protein